MIIVVNSEQVADFLHERILKADELLSVNPDDKYAQGQKKAYDDVLMWFYHKQAYGNLGLKRKW